MIVLLIKVFYCYYHRRFYPFQLHSHVLDNYQHDAQDCDTGSIGLLLRPFLLFGKDIPSCGSSCSTSTFGSLDRFLEPVWGKWALLSYVEYCEVMTLGAVSRVLNPSLVFVVSSQSFMRSWRILPLTC